MTADGAQLHWNGCKVAILLLRHVVGVLRKAVARCSVIGVHKSIHEPKQEWTCVQECAAIAYKLVSSITCKQVVNHHYTQCYDGAISILTCRFNEVI